MGLGAQEVGSPDRARAGGSRAFTLVELLIVIAIIAILAALVFPITKAVNRTKLRSRAKAEMEQIATAIDSYKAKLGFFPPDNTTNVSYHQLYYELAGTTLQGPAGGQFYQTLDNSSDSGARLNTASFAQYFPIGDRPVRGLMNSGAAGAGDEVRSAAGFLKGIKANQIGLVQSGGGPVRVLVCTVQWPYQAAGQWQPIPSAPALNPWRYNSTNPTNNPGSYELWTDIIIDGKTNRICNWSKDPLIVYNPR